jgi:hypothetical protein
VPGRVCVVFDPMRIVDLARARSDLIFDPVRDDVGRF